MRQWLRKVRVTFQGDTEGFVVNPSDRVDDHEMRVSFEISRGISGSPNLIQVTIYNLTKSHRQAVGRELDLVTIEAGYVPPEGGGNLGIIGKGRLRDVIHERQGADILTTLSCGDGDLAHRRATVSKTIPKGSTVKDAIDSIYTDMEAQGIGKGEWKLGDYATYKRPYSMCGSCTHQLDLLGRTHSFYWNIQNEVLEIIPSDGYLPGQVRISAETGMIGTPTITDNGMRVECLLNPEIRPNRTVQIVSDLVDLNAQDGIYRVSQVNFSGDNYGGDFKASVEGEAVSSTKVDEGITTLKLNKYKATKTS